MSTACAPITLAANGVLAVAGATPTTIFADAVYFPPCPIATATALASRSIIVTGTVSTDETWIESPQYSDLRDHFYATVFPQCYALAATTVLAYMLLVMLVIAPRSFLDGGVVTLGRSGFTNGNSNGISIGGRPWLQKIATLLVAVSLTIATADTFRVAENQYMQGYQDARKLQQAVLEGTELKTIQLISDTFLWLAQAQTLIRLFPRQREKVIIKWTAFALITFDVIFGALNSFRYMTTNNAKPRQFTDAVPALSYLFQLSLGFLYAAWVLYYALTKKRYAFYHPLMKNISLMAALSIGALLIPVVFFVLDIAEPRFTGWGDYVRWVGAAAASVVVWEWVERIEALEREEKKDGVLGREVFDGDEMIDMSPSNLPWPRGRKNRRNNGDGGGGDISAASSSGAHDNMSPEMGSSSRRSHRRSDDIPGQSQFGYAPRVSVAGRTPGRFLQPPLWPSRPPPTVTPVSRTDTASADSTIYRVRYQPLTNTVSRTTDHNNQLSPGFSPVDASRPDTAVQITEPARTPVLLAPDYADHEPGKRHGFLPPWKPFPRQSRDAPVEVLPHTMPNPDTSQRERETFSRWDIRSRIEDFTATQAERIFQRLRPTPDMDSLPVTVIPAPPRRGAALARLLEEEENSAGLSSSPSPSQPDPRNMSATSHTPVSAPPRRSQTHSGVVSPTRLPFPSPSGRNETSLLLSDDRRYGVSDTDEDQRNTMCSGRRPVDDMIRDQP